MFCLKIVLIGAVVEYEFGGEVSVRSLPLVLVLGLVLGGVNYFGDEKGKAVTTAGQYDRYFSTPQAAVTGITDLLKAQDWTTLSTYYDLTGSAIDQTALKNGSYFVTEQPAEKAKNVSLRFKQPFAPGFQYRATKPIGSDEFEVSLMIEINNGDGTVRRALDALYLKAYPEGYQILPK